MLERRELDREVLETLLIKIDGVKKKKISPRDLILFAGRYRNSVSPEVSKILEECLEYGVALLPDHLNRIEQEAHRALGKIRNA